MRVYMSSLAIIRALEILAHKIVLIIFDVIIKSSKIYLYLELYFEYLLVTIHVCMCKHVSYMLYIFMCNKLCFIFH